jgi:Tol biopolymer transport system component
MAVKILFKTWIFLVLMGVFSCKVTDKKVINGCFPAEHLPAHISPLTEFGERSEWSHDGKTIYFIDKAGGEVWKVDIATKELAQISKPEFRPEGHGYYRVYELSNGDLFFTCGPERHNLYMQILKRDGDGLPVKIDESIDEGPAISRTDMKIVWTPDQQVIYSGTISYEGDKITIKDKRLIIDNDSVVVDGIKYDGILEPQNFIRPEEKLVTWTQYGNTEAGLFTSEVMVYNLETNEIFNYSKSPNEYSEPEGIFPDGKYTLIESDKHCLKGIKQLDIYKLKLDGKGKDTERLTFFNDIEGYKASNPVVNDDGKYFVFQAAQVEMDTGVGCGIYLFDMEKWEKIKNRDR